MRAAIYDRVTDDQIEEEVLFLLSWGFDLKPLKTSISRVGLVSPLVVKPHQGRFRLICGHRRRQALRELGQEEFFALILPDEYSLKQMLVLALEENLGHRVFNDAEKALALNHLASFFPSEELIVHFLPRLGLPPRREFLERFLGLVQLGSQGLTALAEGSLDPETGELLLALDPVDRSALLDLLDQFKPNRNKRRQIVTWLHEISQRDGRSVGEVLSDKALQAVIEAENLSRPDKGKKAQEIIHAWRYPELSQAQEKQARLTARLRLPAGIGLQTSPWFEGLAFSFNLSFINLDDLMNGLDHLSEIAASPEMAALLELG
ncbi:MAG: ParB N-terminal domain-containing protein [Deltaproteobacteria bacterium]|nr:ParB N-terminal domain-containing protein [Deltaproteobacteria bacterium]MBW2086358.1 ParB N-terminal domain-containing protein [Deltaproteobacteria bacterium]